MHYGGVCLLQTCLRHPESTTARENRDTVFCQMRRAMDLIHYVVKDGVLNSDQMVPGTQVLTPLHIVLCYVIYIVTCTCLSACTLVGSYFIGRGMG